MTNDELRQKKGSCAPVGPGITVRRAVRSDFPEWSELWRGYNAFYKRELPLEVTQATWERFFDDREPMHAWVAESGSRLVGMAHFLFHRSTSMVELNCYLQDLFTEESARGQGVGKALIQAVCEEAKAAGSVRVYWQTHESNRAAMKLYDQVAERSGFIVYRKALE